MSFAARLVAREFERWMRSAEQSLSEPASSHDDFARLVAVATRAGCDVLDAGEIEHRIDVLFDLEPDGDGLLDTLHDYLHFRIETTADDAWAGRKPRAVRRLTRAPVAGPSAAPTRRREAASTTGNRVRHDVWSRGWFLAGTERGARRAGRLSRALTDVAGRT